MKIRILDASLARRIAAGEVIERPASVVKELVENSVDAKSESIAIELEEGGARSIMVRDDGDGMDETDLALCVQRHATSKIAREEDLDRIATLGFRGEALASVAAVARVRIVSCPFSDQEAHEVRVTAGELEGPFPAGRGRGTTVEVRDLFFNLPARARFLGAARTEFLHSSRVVQRMALATPAIGWTLRHGERVALEAGRAASLLERIAQIYGAEVARALVPLEAEREGVRVSGYVSRPDLRRGNRRDQLFCVNGRPVSDRALSYVLASAYQRLLRPGAYPVAVVSIDLPFDQVDVNVHPRKEEVRFGASRAVQDALAQALHVALGSPHVAAPLLPEGGAFPARKAAGDSVAEPRLPLRVEAAVRQALRDQTDVRVESTRRAIGQLHRTYLLVEGPDGLEIVDQHIAHERILYDGLRAERAKGEIPRQRFLIPVRLELSLEGAALVAAAREDLEQAGIGLDEFGGGTFLLREYPSLLAERQARQGFQAPIERIAELMGGGEKPKEALFHQLFTEIACAAAIKAGDRLPLDEQQRLVEQLMALDDWQTCPHGRPIVFAVSREDLARRFQRR